MILAPGEGPSGNSVDFTLGLGFEAECPRTVLQRHPPRARASQAPALSLMRSRTARRILQGIENRARACFQTRHSDQGFLWGPRFALGQRIWIAPRRLSAEHGKGGGRPRPRRTLSTAARSRVSEVFEKQG